MTSAQCIHRLRSLLRAIDGALGRLDPVAGVREVAELRSLADELRRWVSDLESQPWPSFVSVSPELVSAQRRAELVLASAR